MRLAIIATVTMSLFAANAGGQGSSDPEIYLARLYVSHGSVAVARATNVTNRRGYDNQPSFSPDGKSLLFTSTREDAQSDIYRYDIATRATTRLTRTAESEYSATFLPSGARFSVIRVEKDSAQRLWSFAADGSDPRLVLTDIKPVGYHAWIDASHLALFVLASPSSLVLANAKTGSNTVLARDIGRSLLPMPGGHAFSFLLHRGREWDLTEVQLAGDSVRFIHPLVTLPAGMDYVAWVDDTAVGGVGTRLFSWRAGGQWTEIADLATSGLTRISRIAVSADHRYLAIVAEPAK